MDAGGAFTGFLYQRYDFVAQFGKGTRHIPQRFRTFQPHFDHLSRNHTFHK